MNRSPLRSLVLVVALGGMVGCTTFRYMRDPSPELEQSRQEYVVNNPGNRYNGDISEGRVRMGMSRLQVRTTWGDPDRSEAGRFAGSTVWSYDEEDPARGVVEYRLQFAGERLQNVEILRGANQLPADRVREATKRDDAGLKTQAGKKPGAPR